MCVHACTCMHVKHIVKGTSHLVTEPENKTIRGCLTAHTTAVHIKPPVSIA